MEIRERDILRVELVREEKTNGKSVFVYWPENNFKTKGLLFPLDEIVFFE